MTTRKSVLLLSRNGTQQLETIGYRKETPTGVIWVTSGEDMWIEGTITHWAPLPERPELPAGLMHDHINPDGTEQQP
jgi:hypothetical protein